MDAIAFTFQGVRDGRTSHELYNTHQMMIRRCYQDNYASFINYGAKGVKVCQEWLGPFGFWSFVSDMGPRPVGMTLDRIDPFGDYCKDNCRWETKPMQANNTRLQNARNTSGMAGVSWCAKSGRYVVQLTLNNKRTRIGAYTEEFLEEAKNTYLEAKTMKISGFSDDDIYKKFVIDKRAEGSLGVIRRNKTSKYWGVSYKNKQGKWQAAVPEYLGIRDTEEEAYALVKEWIRQQEELKIGPSVRSSDP